MQLWEDFLDLIYWCFRWIFDYTNQVMFMFFVFMFLTIVIKVMRDIICD